jgi:hypothetical protein
MASRHLGISRRNLDELGEEEELLVALQSPVKVVIAQ